MTPTWEDLMPGTPVPERVAPPLTLEDFVRYAGASGDFSPPHYDVDAARLAGRPGATAAGMLLAGALAATLTDWVGPERVRRLHVRFHGAAWPDDVVTYGGVVARRWRDGPEGRVAIEVAARRAGDLLVSGEAIFALP